MFYTLRFYSIATTYCYHHCYLPGCDAANMPAPLPLLRTLSSIRIAHTVRCYYPVHFLRCYFPTMPHLLLCSGAFHTLRCCATATTLFPCYCTFYGGQEVTGGGGDMLVATLTIVLF